MFDLNLSSDIPADYKPSARQQACQNLAAGLLEAVEASDMSASDKDVARTLLPSLLNSSARLDVLMGEMETLLPQVREALTSQR